MHTLFFLKLKSKKSRRQLFSFLLTFFFLAKKKVSGGHKWTRTIDLTLIRRAL